MENGGYQKRVGVDVYVWLLRQQESQDISIEGVYRHIVELIREYEPVAFVGKDCWMPPKWAFDKVEAYIGKSIRVVDETSVHEYEVWFSTGVDFCPPFFQTEPWKGLHCAILHDAFSAKGYYGEEALKRFMYGASVVDWFFYISQSALNEFKQECARLDIGLTRKRFVPYSAPHSYKNINSVYFPPITIRRGCVSVSSVFKRKNVLKGIDVAKHLDLNFTHVGRFGDEDPKLFIDAISGNKILYLGQRSDEELSMLYWNALVYVNLSKEEGYSIPPMEALLHGVPHLILSDIPAHRENYGGFEGVVLVDPNSPVEDMIRKGYLSIESLPSMKECEVESVFARQHPFAVAKVITVEIEQYLKQRYDNETDSGTRYGVRD